MAEGGQTSHLAKHGPAQRTGIAQGMEKKDVNSEIFENAENEIAQQPVYQVRPHMHEK